MVREAARYAAFFDGLCILSQLDPCMRLSEFCCLLSQTSSVLVYLLPRFIRERERQRNARIRLQRLTEQETSFGSSSHLEVHLRPVESRHTILEYLQAVSTAVQEGDLSDDEELSETSEPSELASPKNLNNMKAAGTMKPTGDEVDHNN